MKPVLLLLLSYLLFSFQIRAQEGKMIKLDAGLSYNFLVNGERVPGKKAKKMISVDPEALYSFESARQNKTVSHIFAGLGVAGLAYSTAAFVSNDMNTKWGIFAGSVALVGFAVPLYISAEKQMCGALEKYNKRFDDNGTSFYRQKRPTIRLFISSHQAGLAMSF